jgi:glycogen operon protein
MRGDSGTVQAFAHRLTGSPDVYAHKEREAEQSINFVTCHDGFHVSTISSPTTPSTTRRTGTATSMARSTT